MPICIIFEFCLSNIHIVPLMRTGFSSHICKKLIMLTLARTYYFPILERTWGVASCNPPCHFTPNWDRTVGQRPNESLGCCESNDTRVDLFRSYLDPSRSGQRKKRWRFEDLRFFANNFPTKKDSGIIQAPACFSLQDASKHIHFHIGKSSWKFDLRSK